MSPERQEKAKKPVVLTSSQEQTAQSILGIVKGAQDHRVLVILEGLSGVGKTTVLDSIHDALTLNNARAVEDEVLRYDHYAKEIEGFNGHLVTPITPPDLNYLEEALPKRHPSLRVAKQILTGMNEEETGAFVSELPTLDQSSLTPAQIAKYSLGIPHLAERLTMPGLTEDMAARMAGKFLFTQFHYVWTATTMHDSAKPFLAVPIPREVLDVVPETSDPASSENIYNDLYFAFQRQAELAEKGIMEERPLFVAPESEEIYNTMLRKSGRASIDIFVPDLQPEDLARMRQAFGNTEWGGYRDSEGTRTRMFNANYRKVSFWHRDANGNEVTEDNEHHWLDRAVKGYFDAYKKGQLALTPIERPQQVSFYVHAHEHNNMTYHPAAIGWMVETLLQQRGIAYFVNNDTYGTSYVYRPEQKHIEKLPELVNVRGW